MAAARTGTLIVGAGQAGVQIAASLRELGDEEPIVLAGAEPRLPYQRPPLSKAYLAGKATAGSLTLRTAAWYDTSAISLRLDTPVASLMLDAPGSGAGEAITAAGETIGFARLALATGGQAVRLPLPGASLEGVCYLRHVVNADELRERLAAATSMVVIGGGFIGLEAAAAATAAGADVTVVDVADRLLGRAVAPVVSAFYRSAHERRGTKVLLNTAVAAIEAAERGGVAGVRLADGRLLPADLVLIGVGMQPSTDLGAALGLKVDRGIVVDGLARTSHPGVVAAGDCTTAPHPRTGQGLIRIESVQNAIGQARIAAATLLGADPGPGPVPWFWSDQGDLKLQIAGISAGYDQVVLRGDTSSEKFSVLYYAAGQLIAADAVNAPRDYMVVRKVLGDGGTIPADQAGDASVPLRDLMTAAA